MSVAPPNKLQTTLLQRASYIENLQEWLVRQFWMMIIDAGLMPPLPASDPIGKWMHLLDKKKKNSCVLHGKIFKCKCLQIEKESKIIGGRDYLEFEKLFYCILFKDTFEDGAFDTRNPADVSSIGWLIWRGFRR